MQTIIEQLYQNINGPIQDAAAKIGIRVKASAHYLDFIKGLKIVRLSVRHSIYALDIINSFDYYFDAVESQDFSGFRIVDYSMSRYHDVVGFELMPVYFPSLAEPIVTTNQYIDFAGLGQGGVVLDLGAYSGLTSIIFKEKVGSSGRVIAVDADAVNVLAIKKNFDLYKKISGNEIEFIHGAVWSHCDGLSFSSEGNMGSSASEIVGYQRGNNVSVKSYTLEKIAEEFQLERIDFIKCDIEGGERVVFENKGFFDKYRPRIIVESHVVGAELTTEKFTSDLRRYGYNCKNIHQVGVSLPLVECYP